jgi:hypothetical protein
LYPNLMARAFAGIERDGHVDAKPQMIRIEKL